MTTDEAHDVQTALRELATWYPPADELDRPFPQLEPPTERLTRPARLAFALASLLAVGATVAGGLLVARGTSLDSTAGDQLAPGLSPERAMTLCLPEDAESDFELDPLRADGRLHVLGSPEERPLPLVVAGDELHVACLLTEREDDDWLQVVAIPNAHLPVAPRDISVVTAATLEDETFVFGQRGTAVDSVEVDNGLWSSARSATIDEDWWAVGFDDEARQGLLPYVEVQWINSDGQERRNQARDLVPNSEWILCANDDECRALRLTELRSQVDPDSDQAAALADGVVSDDEYAEALRRWGACIAKVTGLDVTFRDDGFFIIDGSREQTDDAFESCQAEHAAAVVEASALQRGG